MEKVPYLHRTFEQFPCPACAYVPGGNDYQYICEGCAVKWVKEWLLRSHAKAAWPDATIAECASHLSESEELVFGIRERETGLFLDLTRAREEAARRSDSSAAGGR
jgi:hypothetical protein